VLGGADRVGAPVVVDTHRPGAAAVAPFAPPPADALPRTRRPAEAAHPDGAPRPDGPRRTGGLRPAPLPLDGASITTDATRTDAPGACRLVVRALRPPRAVEVFAERDAPAFVRGPGLGGRVVGAAGPWRVAVEWWSDAPLARDYWDLELTDGGLYRCYRECASGGWFVDGVYD
jgi:hypothetical protein